MCGEERLLWKKMQERTKEITATNQSGKVIAYGSQMPLNKEIVPVPKTLRSNVEDLLLAYKLARIRQMWNGLPDLLPLCHLR